MLRNLQKLLQKKHTVCSMLRAASALRTRVAAGSVTGLETEPIRREFRARCRARPEASGARSGERRAMVLLT